MLQTLAFKKAIESSSPIIFADHRHGKTTLAAHLRSVDGGTKYLVADEPSEIDINRLLEEPPDGTRRLKILVRSIDASLLSERGRHQLNRCLHIHWNRVDLCAAALHLAGIEVCYDPDIQAKYLSDRLWTGLVDCKGFVDPGLLYEAIFEIAPGMQVSQIGTKRLAQLATIGIHLNDGQLKGLMLPCSVREIEERLSPGVLTSLIDSGVVMRLRLTDRIDMTEIFRNALGCGRKGGVRRIR